MWRLGGMGKHIWGTLGGCRAFSGFVVHRGGAKWQVSPLPRGGVVVLGPGCHDRYIYIWGGRVHGHGGVKGGGELGPGIVGGVQSGRTGRVLTPRAVHEWTEWWCVEHALRPGYTPVR